MKKVVRLTESKLRNLIKECVKSVLNEGYNDLTDYEMEVYERKKDEFYRGGYSKHYNFKDWLCEVHPELYRKVYGYDNNAQNRDVRRQNYLDNDSVYNGSYRGMSSRDTNDFKNSRW